MTDYRSSDPYRNSSTYPGGSSPPVTADMDTAVSGSIAVVQRAAPKSQIRRYIFPYWEVAAEEEAQRDREREGDIAREQELEAAEAAQAEAAAVAQDEPSPEDDALVRSLADSLIAASREAVAAKRPVEIAEPVAVAATYALPDDLYFAPIVPAVPAVVVTDDPMIWEAIAIIETIEMQECH